MKNRFSVLAAGLMFGGFAGAQIMTMETGDSWNVTGCYKAPGGVQCDLTYNLVSKDSDSFTVWTGDGVMKAMLPTGGIITADKVSVAPDTWDSHVTLSAYKGIPSKISVHFPVASPVTNFNYLFIYKVRAANVPVRASATAPAPAPAPAAAAPKPALNQTVNLGNATYTATLTNCRASGANTFVCTATLRR